MMLIETTGVPEAALPVAEFREHLRLGSGFADDGFQDPVLIGALRAALAVVEKETGKALYARTFKWMIAAWRDIGRQSLPVAPVSAIRTVTIADMSGGEIEADPATYRLVQDAHRPDLLALGWSLPTIPVGGTAEIVFDAGFGPTWGDIPDDIAQAVLMLAARYYEQRGGGGAARAPLPDGVEPILARHRSPRLFGGRR